MTAVDSAPAFFAEQTEPISGLVGRYLRDLRLIPEDARVRFFI